MNRDRRQLIKDMEAMGLEIISSRANTHNVFKVKNRHGVVQSIVTSVSPSSRKVRVKRLSVLRSFAEREA